MYNDTEKTEWDWEGIRDADSSSFRLSPNEIVVVSPEVFSNPVLLLKLFGYGIATMYFLAK